MKTRIRRTALLPLAILAALLGSSTVGTAAAASVPFTDPSASGSIGFCDKFDHPVTSGRLTDVPFAWKAVSSAVPPAAYQVATTKATLYGFSPIKDVDPSDWSPYRMTGSSSYSNLKVPMAAATLGDAPLQWQSTAFPPKLDNLVQLRIILTNPAQGALTTSYPTAVIRISGNTWTLVAGDANPNCKAGAAQSSELLLLPKKVQPTAAPAGATTPTAAAVSNGGSATPGSTSAATAPSDSAAAPGVGNGDPVAAAAASSASPASSASHAAVVVAVLLALIAAVAGGVAVVAARRRDEPTGRH